jgi:hypothetical protein
LISKKLGKSKEEEEWLQAEAKQVRLGWVRLTRKMITQVKTMNQCKNSLGIKKSTRKSKELNFWTKEETKEMPQ